MTRICSLCVNCVRIALMVPTSEEDAAGFDVIIANEAGDTRPAALFANVAAKVRFQIRLMRNQFRCSRPAAFSREPPTALHFLARAIETTAFPFVDKLTSW